MRLKFEEIYAIIKILNFENQNYNINNFKVKMSDGRNRGGRFNNSNYGGDNRGGPDGEVDEYIQDFKEKRKLLVRWNHYFPHESVKEFDVSFFIFKFKLQISQMISSIFVFKSSLRPSH